MKAVIIGGDSRLGSALAGVIRSGHPLNEVMCTTRRPDPDHPYPQVEFDMSDPGPLPVDLRIAIERASVVFIVAAITKVVDCEADPSLAWRVNADAPVKVALTTFAVNRRVVFVSSDAVMRAPNLVYAKAKLFAETVILSMGGRVVRPSRIPANSYNDLARVLRDTHEFSTYPALLNWDPE